LSTPGAESRTEIHGTCTAEDGTPLVWRRSGEGPPLLLLHGTGASHRRWQPVLPALESHFTVYNLDRRGRGGSGDADPYVLEREFGDVVAAVEAIGGPVDVIGHSYGGLCALEAAPLLGSKLRKLIVYEPPMNVTPVPLASPDVIAHLEGLLASGDREGIVTGLMRDLVGVPPDELERMRTLPVWQARIDAAPTIPRELRAVLDYRFDPVRFEKIATPTLLLLGGESPPNVQAATRAIAAALPRAEVVVLPGQGHVAMDSAPDLFVSEVLRFLHAD
jgi:pimeloyl-ACP methyl ester carboxylesterase